MDDVPSINSNILSQNSTLTKQEKPPAPLPKNSLLYEDHCYVNTSIPFKSEGTSECSLDKTPVYSENSSTKMPQIFPDSDSFIQQQRSSLSSTCAQVGINSSQNSHISNSKLSQNSNISNKLSSQNLYHPQPSPQLSNQTQGNSQLSNQTQGNSQLSNQTQGNSQLSNQMGGNYMPNTPLNQISSNVMSQQSSKNDNLMKIANHMQNLESNTLLVCFQNVFGIFCL